MKPKGYFLFAYFLFIATLAFAGVAFSDIDINTENEILFLAEQNVVGVPVYKTLCTTSASSNADSYKLLTCFPEKIDIAASGKAFDIRNRYGTARYTFSDGSLKWIYTSKNIPSGFTRTSSALASPDDMPMIMHAGGMNLGIVDVTIGVIALIDDVLEVFTQGSLDILGLLWGITKVAKFLVNS